METVCELNNVSISHKEYAVLQNIDLKIEKGELLYIIGKTGSGKSTLLKALYGEIPLKSGTGDVCGHRIDKIKRKEIPFLRRKLGFVFQDFQLLTDRSVYDNLSFVLKATGWTKKREIDSQINKVLGRVGLQHKGYKMPHELSGGEQQSVVIARAILNSPTLILADEPTGNLDTETSENIMKLLIDLRNEGTTIIFATHDTAILNKFKSRTIICTENTITEREDTVLNFINLEEQIDALFGTNETKENDTEYIDIETNN